MSQVTPVIDSGYSFVNKLSPLRRPVNYMQCTSAGGSSAWSTPNLASYPTVITPRAAAPPPPPTCLQTFASSSSQSSDSNLNVRNMVLTTSCASSKLPMKKSDPCSRIPGPGSGHRAGSSSALRSKNNSTSSSHSGVSSQSSLAMIGGRENARRSASPAVSSGAVKSSTNSLSSSSSLSSVTAVSKPSVNSSVNSGTSTNNCNVPASECRTRRPLTSDKNTLNNNCNKLSIRPPRPTSIPSVTGEVKSPALSTVNGKNVINNKYATHSSSSSSSSRVAGGAGKSVTGNNSSVRAPPQQQPQSQQQQCAPLKEFMANRRIVESNSPLSTDYCFSKIATIAPSTKVFTSVTYSGSNVSPTEVTKLSRAPPLTPPSSLSPLTGVTLEDKQNISTNQITSDSRDHLTMHTERVQQTPSSVLQAPPVTPRKTSLTRRSLERGGGGGGEGCAGPSTKPVDTLSNVPVKVCDSSKGLSVSVRPCDSQSIHCSKQQHSNGNCSLLNCSPSEAPPPHDEERANNSQNASLVNSTTNLSTFTITSTVTSTSPSPAREDESNSSLHLPSPPVDCKLTPSHNVPPVRRENKCKEDQVKSTNGPNSVDAGGGGGGGGGDGGVFDRINVVTCKASQSVELDEASTRALFSFINSSTATATATTTTACTCANSMSGQSQLSTTVTSSTLPNHSQGKSIHVYPFIRGETASSSLAQLPVSSLLHSLSTRRLDKIANVNTSTDGVAVNSDMSGVSEYIPGMSLARSSFNLTGGGGGGGNTCTYTRTSPISFSSFNATAGGGGDITFRPCDIESVGVKFPSMRNLVTPPPTPFGASVNGSTSHLRRLSKNSDLRGSAASLLSGSSNFSSAEEKQASEIKRLKSELNRANEKVATLSTQLVTSSQMLSAFDQSLSSMANRMHQINLACEHKDRTIEKLSRTIEELRRDSESRGGVEDDNIGGVTREPSESAAGRRRMNSVTSSSHSSLSSTLPQWSRKSGSCDQLNGKKVRMRSASRDSRGTVTSASPSASATADSSATGWIRQSISRAFRKSRTRSKSGNESGSDGESLGSRSNLSSVTDGNGCVKASTSTSFSPEAASAASSPPASSRVHQQSPLEKTNDSTFTTSNTVTRQVDDVTQLKMDVEKKERALTDLRLESLSMAHQMESMKESMVKMKSQIDDLLSDNLRLQLLLSASKAAAAASDKANSFNGNLSKFPPSPVTSCDELYSQNTSDPLMIALKRLQDATVD